MCAAFIEGAQGSVGASGNPETQFTFTSLFALTPSAAGTCADSPPIIPTDPPSAPLPCGPGGFRTGITCRSAACGRPADWPEGEPYFLDVDLHNPLTWQLFGLGLPAARLLQGLSGASILYSEEELSHLGVRSSPAPPEGLLRCLTPQTSPASAALHHISKHVQFASTRWLQNLHAAALQPLADCAFVPC